MKNVDDGSNLVRNDQIVEMLSQAIYRGAGALKYVPDLVRDLIIQDRWRRRVIRRTGELQMFVSFEEFVTTQPLEGLGTDIETLRSLCVNDPEVNRMIDHLVSNPASVKIDGVPFIVTYLEENYPDLAEQVIRGDLTPRQVAFEAGFQERRTRLFPGDIDDTANKVVQVLELEWGKDSNEALRELIKRLSLHLK